MADGRWRTKAWGGGGAAGNDHGQASPVWKTSDFVVVSLYPTTSPSLPHGVGHFSSCREWVGGGPISGFFFPAFYVSNEPLQKLLEYPSLSHTSTKDTSEGLLQKQGHLALEWDGRQDACRQGVVGCSAPADPHSSWELLLRERPPHKAHRGQMTVWTSTGACAPNLRIQVQGGHRMSAGLECLCPPVGRRVTNTTC